MSIFERLFHRGRCSPSVKGSQAVSVKLDSLKSKNGILFKRIGKKIDVLDYCPVTNVIALGCSAPREQGARDIFDKLASLCLVSANNGKTIWEQSLDWKAPRFSTPEVKDLAFSPDGSLLCAVGTTGAEVRDAYSGKRVATLSGSPYEYCHAVTISTDGKLVAIGATLSHRSHWIGVYATEKCRRLFEYRHGGEWLRDVSFRPGSWELAIGDSEGTTIILDCESANERTRWSTAIPDVDQNIRLTAGLSYSRGSTREIVKLSYEPGGHLLAITYGNGTIEVRESESGTLIKTLPGHSEMVRSDICTLMWLGDRSRLLSSGYDGSIRLWNVSEGKVIWKIMGNPVYSYNHPVAVTTDGRMIEAGVEEGLGMDGKLRVWR